MENFPKDNAASLDQWILLMCADWILPPQLPKNFRICSLLFFHCQLAKYFKHFPLTNVSLWGKVH